jgi:hypothetical protein
MPCELFQESRLEVGPPRILMLRTIDAENEPTPASHLDTKDRVADEAKQAQPLCAKAELGKRLTSYPSKHIELEWSGERLELHRSRASSSAGSHV